MDLKLLNHAREYIEKMAKGINPLTNESIPADDLLNNIKISRCLFYVGDVLDKVIQKETFSKMKKVPFYLKKEEILNYEYSEKPITLSEVTERINHLISREGMSKLSVKKMHEWLVSIGALQEEMEGNTKAKRPTSMGSSIGITTESRISSRGVPYKINMYDKHAQEFIVDNFENLLRFK